MEKEILRENRAKRKHAKRNPGKIMMDHVQTQVRYCSNGRRTSGWDYLNQEGEGGQYVSGL